ncbi:MAG: GTP cyclohydrolase I, partial [Calditrichia bacterium]|nr:GTP cyclohydrolase I [Calditrichia bacterium]
MSAVNRDKIMQITHDLLIEVGEDPQREGLVRTPLRVAKAWEFFSKGYRTELDTIINEAIFKEECTEMV